MVNHLAAWKGGFLHGDSTPNEVDLQTTLTNGDERFAQHVQ